MGNQVRLLLKEVTFCMKLRFGKLMRAPPLLQVGIDHSSILSVQRSAEQTTEQHAAIPHPPGKNNNLDYICLRHSW